MTAWLDIVGIGEDGIAGLSPASRGVVAAAEVIVGGDRHHDLTSHTRAERISWPSPFNAMIETIKAQKGRRIVVLVTGDPLWYSVGARILRAIPADEITFHPQLSAFQLAAARMGWSLADATTLTVHGRPVEQALPFFAPGSRLLVLTRDGRSPAELAGLLRDNGYPDSRMTVLAALGGPRESRTDGTARDAWDGAPDFHILAVECIADPEARILPRGPGLPDDAFEHDGKMTKQEMRALTLAALAPRRGAHLWDIGAGSGSVGIEWMRAARDATAQGLEPRADRRAMAARNAVRLGAPRYELIDGTAPEALDRLDPPDAVFVGGGLSQEAVARSVDVLRAHGRLVANAVTLETEQLLIDLHARLGGSLTRVAVSRAQTVGPYRGWRPLMPVTQWVWVK